MSGNSGIFYPQVFCFINYTDTGSIILKIFLIGVDGQLGTDISKHFTKMGAKVHGLIGLKEINICDFDKSRELIRGSDPDIVINTAAFHNVDLCEDEVMQAFNVNVAGVKNIAGICREMNIPLMHFSTDYVFDGEKRTPYIEEDCPGPSSIYAISRLGGERVVQYMLEKYYLVRLSGLYGYAGCAGKDNINFVEIMLGLADTKKQISVVDDQVLTPWYEFACKIFKLAGIDIEVLPISSGEFGAKAIRPGYSVLDNAGLRRAGLSDLRDWKEALGEYIRNRD